MYLEQTVQYLLPVQSINTVCSTYKMHHKLNNQ